MSKAAEADENVALPAQANETSPQLPRDKEFSLVVMQGNSIGKKFPITRWTVIIGRDASVSDLVIDDPGASRSHACLEYRNGQFSIEDLESTNGLCVNEQMVQRANLEPGSQITIGKTIMQFVMCTKLPLEKR